MAKGRRAPPKQNPYHHPKLAHLPKDAEAKVTKRPLPRPPIPSPYTSSATPKVIYVSAKTPFLGAVKRVQKLLHLAEKRLVQSATTIQKSAAQDRKRKRAQYEDEVQEVARLVEQQRKKPRQNDGLDGGAGGVKHTGAEEVTIKASGKAVDKALQLAAWFQQRQDEYVVRLRTASAIAIDDIEMEETLNTHARTGTDEAMRKDAQVVGTSGAGNDENIKHMEHGRDETLEHPAATEETPRGQDAISEVPETRLRYTSVIEVAVSLC